MLYCKAITLEQFKENSPETVLRDTRKIKYTFSITEIYSGEGKTSLTQYMQDRDISRASSNFSDTYFIAHRKVCVGWNPWRSSGPP